MTETTSNAQAADRVAVVLFNLGGPDRPDAVQPFLFNLFNDPAIIRLPGIVRTPLAHLISRRRAKEATEIYAEIGGGSPLLPNTQAQAEGLQTALSASVDARVFIAMRYWHPMSLETALAVQEFGPDSIVLLPLYPQFSSTTSASSIRLWHKTCKQIGLSVPTRTVCCYPLEQGFIAESVNLVRTGIEAASKHGKPRVLFSAHGLPESVVKDGDPYQWQVEQTSAKLVEALGIADLDWVSCYQSRVGPLQWIKPSTDDEIKRAGADGVPVVVYPLAFVSEHSETLVELDIEYRELADESGVPHYERVPTVDARAHFIAGLADLVQGALSRPENLTASNTGKRLCPASWSNCPATVHG